MMDAISEARLADVMPALAAKIHTMADMLAEEYIRVTQAMRTWGIQQSLFQIGRTLENGIWVVTDEAIVVTNCPGGYSYHNYGMAVDCVPSQFGSDQPYNPDWHKEHPTWIRMEQVGKSLGLDCGAFWRTFKDAPHFQLTGRFPEGEPDDEVRQLFRDGGMQAVWEVAGI